MSSSIFDWYCGIFWIKSLKEWVITINRPLPKNTNIKNIVIYDRKSGILNRLKKSNTDKNIVARNIDRRISITISFANFTPMIMIIKALK